MRPVASQRCNPRQTKVTSLKLPKVQPSSTLANRTLFFIAARISQLVVTTARPCEAVAPLLELPSGT